MNTPTDNQILNASKRYREISIGNFDVSFIYGISFPTITTSLKYSGWFDQCHPDDYREKKSDVIKRLKALNLYPIRWFDR